MKATLETALILRIQLKDRREYYAISKEWNLRKDRSTKNRELIRFFRRHAPYYEIEYKNGLLRTNAYENARTTKREINGIASVSLQGRNRKEPT